ncbi:MarR family winged helix-turn-helix transcriptional regulator [Nocardia sp. CA-129566]|uniref:MarR family winged helix-turn-helix transcriptional regulator n=1 Tax=Nocardia sp. CA-129566 TaxID=3239976 RepID=UPI003D991673
MSSGDASSVELRLGLLLRQAQRRAAAVAATALASLGLSGRHFGVMLLLARDGISTQKQLLTDLGSDKAGMVRTVDELDRRGFIVRSQSPHDRRLYHLSLTETGRTAFDAARELADTAAQDIFAGLTPEERITLADLLSRVANPPPP